MKDHIAAQTMAQAAKVLPKELQQKIGKMAIHKGPKASRERRRRKRAQKLVNDDTGFTTVNEALQFKREDNRLNYWGIMEQENKRDRDRRILSAAEYDRKYNRYGDTTFWNVDLADRDQTPRAPRARATARGVRQNA